MLMVANGVPGCNIYHLSGNGEGRSSAGSLGVCVGEGVFGRTWVLVGVIIRVTFGCGVGVGSSGVISGMEVTAPGLLSPPDKLQLDMNIESNTNMNIYFFIIPASQ